MYIAYAPLEHGVAPYVIRDVLSDRIVELAMELHDEEPDEEEIDAFLDSIVDGFGDCEVLGGADVADVAFAIIQGSFERVDDQTILVTDDQFIAAVGPDIDEIERIVAEHLD